MSSSYSNCSLFLYPVSPELEISNTSAIIKRLQELAFLGNRIPAEDSSPHYLTGDRYLDYIAYMGCAPTIQFEADTTVNDGRFCHIRLHHYPTAKLIYSKVQLKPPTCPNCKQPVIDWQTTLSDTGIRCNHCHTISRPDEFNWRKLAGFASLFIEITEIFPKEAVPQQSLLIELENTTGTEWRYFYSCT